MEKVVIFGSTGMTGICAVEAAVQKGLNVRAFVRDPSKLPDNLRNSVEVVKGDVLNYTDVLNAVKNVTAVVAVLGTRNDLNATTVMSEGMRNLIKAMKEQNVEIISELNKDHQREFDLVKESGLKYIAVLPPHIADMPGVEYQVEHDKSPGRAISKRALGKFLIDCLTQPEHYQKVCGICNKSQ